MRNIEEVTGNHTSTRPNTIRKHTSQTSKHNPSDEHAHQTRLGRGDGHGRDHACENHMLHPLCKREGDGVAWVGVVRCQQPRRLTSPVLLVMLATVF
eukprot:m.161615 g.161615  ORF g.161615 m.161615 type:complete len:97 (-) comp18050_c0_seq49:1280-1570(-)